MSTQEKLFECIHTEWRPANENDLTNYDLRTYIILATDYYRGVMLAAVGLSEDQYHVVMDEEHDFSLRGATGGTSYKSGKLRWNLYACRHNFERYITHTVGHEMAHAIVWCQMKRGSRVVSGHGRDWQRVMRSAGLPADRCHKMDVVRAKAKTTWEYVFVECDCDTFWMSTIRHNKQQTGRANYRCMAHSSEMKWTGRSKTIRAGEKY